MQQSNVEPKELRRNVEAQFLRYAAKYGPTPPVETRGVPWSKDKVEDQAEKMCGLMVEPYLVTYYSGDDLLPSEQRLIGERPAFVVAEDGSAFLLYVFDAEDFALATKHSDARFSAWGIRGDAASTFLAR